MRKTMTLLLAFTALSGPLAAAKPQAATPQTHLYWGDTHLHTSHSFDVFLFNTPTSTPETAYRFARGEKVISPTTGEGWQLTKPLDFLVVADHAELVGSLAKVYGGEHGFADTESGMALLARSGIPGAAQMLNAYLYLQDIGSGKTGPGYVTPKQAYIDLHGGTKRQSAWFSYIDTAERFNEPGKFTALIGWEWTSQPGGGNLHRVIFTPDGAEKAKQFMPFSQLESGQPEKLWAWLDATNKRTGADFVAIPHNSNLSWGKMFQVEDSEGNPITADYAERRMRWERVVETTQIKGDSETHPALSPTDEFADYERYSFVMVPTGPIAKPVEADYVRAALKRGLEIEAKTGVNPYKFGLIGSTDAHTGMSSYEETKFGGKGQKDSRPELRKNPTGLGAAKGWDMGAAGIVAVWAPRNDRRSIYDAFQRKEVYASTGPRMAVRLFAGWNFNAGDLDARRFPASGYARGVPMGGDLTGKGKAPSFLVEALKDPDGGNLDRIQIVKGWVDAKGSAHEKVFDVAWSAERKRGKDGKVPAVKNTVDLKTGKYTNSVGAVQLKTLWRDPEYKAGQKAFYYARVLQIPTPRYSLYDAIKLGIDPRETGKPLTIQERAYTSPIWVSAKS
ncbi:MAG: DUF3604 domain-containing protein [Sphingomonadales bacterium]|nr:DUF3604 domain-containing protein [Sphingomonadales bacterium]